MISALCAVCCNNFGYYVCFVYDLCNVQMYTYSVVVAFCLVVFCMIIDMISAI